MNKPNEPVSSVAENPSRDVRKPADAVPPAADARRTAASKPSLRPQGDLRTVSKIRILFISANPSGMQNLSLDEEFRGVTEKIRAAGHRDAFELRCAPAARVDDVFIHLNEYRPHIVHFSGHGEAAEGLILLDRDGRPKPVGGDALARLFAALRKDIRLVVLNACWSKAQAVAIAGTIDCVIGMRTPILDASAILFAETFYLALGFGRSVQNAFDQATARVMMENARQADIPEIVVRDGVNADATVFAGLETPPERAAPSAGSVNRADEKTRRSSIDDFPALAALADLPGNRDALRRLTECVGGRGVIPFVGAGLSSPFGMPLWRDFLLTWAETEELTEEIQSELDAGKYEAVAQRLLDELGAHAFNRRIQEVFGDHAINERVFDDAAVSLVPALASGPAITTNYDRILEKAFERAKRPFEETVVGVKEELTAAAMLRDKRYLLKVHGDWKDWGERILTLADYEERYGGANGAGVDFAKPLPKHLRMMMQNRPLLFLGCGLTGDRLTEILGEIARSLPGVEHFAVVARPKEKQAYRIRARFLSERNVTPVWYPADRHDLVRPLLEWLSQFTPTPFLPRARLINVPPKNDFFTGREEILDDLHEQLKRENRAALKQALSGLGGVGKTQTAAEYAHRRAADFDYILWTNAESASALTMSFISLAERLKLPPHEKAEEIIQEVKIWLATHRRWLLVLDNADTPEIVEGFLPNRFEGKILVTSRAQNFASLGIAQFIEIDVMTEKEALAFLRRRTGRETLTAGEETAAKALAEELGRLPLALEQAGAYVSEQGATFADFLPMIRARLQEAMARMGPQAGDYKMDRETRNRHTVATTWLLNFTQVERESAAAADVLRVSAFLASDAIPLELLDRGAERVSEAVKKVKEEAFLPNELVSPLRRYSLIALNVEERAFTVHRLVQAVTRERLGEGRRDWAARAVNAVNAAFPDPSDFNQWGGCERLAAHAQASTEWIGKYGFEFDEAGRLLNQAGYYLYERGRYGEAKPLYERSLAIREKALGAEHPAMATSLGNLAGLYRAQGEYAQALPLFERSLAIYEKARGAEHPAMATSLGNLAGLYYAQGEYAQALPLFERSLAIREKALGAEHPATASGLNNLAELYRAQGEYAQALPLYARALAIYEKALGAEHPDTARGLNNLAELYRAQGEYAQALPLFERSLAIYEKALGAEHPNTAGGLNNLAALYQAQGEYAQAAPLYERALALTEKALGAEHPATATSLNNLAALYDDQGEYAQAAPLYERALAVTEKALGAEHPETATSLNNLAALYHAQGEYAQAAPLYARALAVTEKALGAEHPDTARGLNNLAELYRAQGDSAQALPLYARALAIYEKALGAEHPATASGLNNLAALYDDQGEYAQAAPLYERALAIYEKALGAEHPDTAMSLNNLALLYQAQGEYAQALPLYERSLAIREKALGAEHPSTAESLNNLAGLYYAQGEYAEAAPLYERSLAIWEKALGAEHPSTAESLNNLAGLYYAQGEYAQALPLYECSLAIWEKALGAEHPATAMSLNNLAALYQAQGDSAQAAPLYARALAIWEKALGAEHPHMALGLNNLAALYQAQGDSAQAAPLYARALAIYEKALGAEHLDTATSLNNLAELYRAQGDSAQAAPLYARALAIREKGLGAEHPDTARSRWGLAWTLREQGRVEQAREMHEAALAGLRGALGEGHPDTKRCAAQLAELM
jgi:tetratricopeptide (TPR) repeat protein